MTTHSEFAPPQTWRRKDILVSSVTINLLTLAMPFVILQVYDRILPNVAYSTLAFLMGGLVAVAVVEVILKISRASILSATGVRFEHQAGVEAFDNILHADTGKTEGGSRDTSPSHYMEGFRSLSQVRDFHSGQTAELTSDLPFALLFLGLIWVIAGSLVLVPIAVLGLFAGATWFYTRHLKGAMEARTQSDERRASFLVEILGGIHTIKSMAMEKVMLRRYERLEAQSAVAVRNLTNIHGQSLSAGYFFSQLAVVSIVVVGSIYVVGSDLTMGGLAACTMLTGRSLRPVLRGMSYWNNYQGQEIALAHAGDLFKIKREAVPDKPRHEDIRGDIALEGVTLKFGDEPALFENLDLSVKSGELIGIVGASGSGKTSLLRLMNGTLEADKGTVKIDGHVLGEYNLPKLRHQIGYLPDSGPLFEGTLLDNVSTFREGVPRRRAMEVMRSIGLDDYVSQLPDGLETKLTGTKADRVPAGIKQRLVLARALVDDPKVLLFDNANNGLDMTSDAKLLKAITDMKGERTIILATRRPSYLKACDRLFELKDGKLLAYELPAYEPPSTERGETTTDTTDEASSTSFTQEAS